MASPHHSTYKMNTRISGAVPRRGDGGHCAHAPLSQGQEVGGGLREGTLCIEIVFVYKRGWVG